MKIGDKVFGWFDYEDDIESSFNVCSEGELKELDAGAQVVVLTITGIGNVVSPQPSVVWRKKK